MADLKLLLFDDNVSVNHGIEKEFDVSDDRKKETFIQCCVKYVN